MEYRQYLIGFQKAGGAEYQFSVYAESASQAIRIARNKLSGKLGDGSFYVIREEE